MSVEWKRERMMDRDSDKNASDVQNEYEWDLDAADEINRVLTPITPITAFLRYDDQSITHCL